MNAETFYRAVFLIAKAKLDADIEQQVREDDRAAGRECYGHPAGPFDPMGVTVYCDGTCL